MCLYIKTKNNRTILAFDFKNNFGKGIRLAIATKSFEYKIKDGLELVNQQTKTYGILYSTIFDYTYKFTKNKYGLKAKINNKQQPVAVFTNALYMYPTLNDFTEFKFSNNTYYKLGYHLNTFRMEHGQNLKEKLNSGFNSFDIIKSSYIPNEYNLNIPIMFNMKDVQLVDEKDIVVRTFVILKPEILKEFLNKSYYKDTILFSNNFLCQYENMYNNLFNSYELERAK